jgi:polyphosphate kinase 2
MYHINKFNDHINEGFFSNLMSYIFSGNDNNHDKSEISSVKTYLLENDANQNIINIFENILKHKNSNQINLNRLLRTLNNVLLKKGDKIENIEKYLNKILKSLDKREHYKDIYSEEDYIDEEDEEKSEIPRKKFETEKKHLQIELLKMQEWLKAQNKPLVIVFEGRDTAGKGSTIKKFTQYLDTKYFKVITKGIPTEQERKNWFERYKSDIEPGKIIFFDRSWYNRGIVEPVMGYSSYDEYQEFMANVNKFEEDLIKSGTYLIKFWLSITKDTQSRRFDIRKKSPLKYWKFSPNDSKAQQKWDEYTSYKKRLFKVTSTDISPWIVIDSNDKRISGLNAIRYVLSKIPYDGKNNDLVNIEYPEVITTIK